MVTYHLEQAPQTLFDEWVIEASYGNHLRWTVGTYRDKRQAQDRLCRLLEMVEAQRQVERL